MKNIRLPMIQAALVGLLSLILGSGALAETQIYYIHTDHLGTPQVMTDQDQNVVWEIEQTPFGETVSESGSVIQPMRFPGQYHDAETGYSYNYYRDYDPSIGRYVQSDPIGLAGGLNTYGYVYQNPLRYIDPYGLESDTMNPVDAAVGITMIFAALAGNQAARDLFSDLGDAIYNSWNSGWDSGLADEPAPYDHHDEDEALDFTPDPFGGGDACERLRYQINVLRAQIAWRRTDLNPASSSYQGHLTRIALLEAALARLEESYRNICGGDCPT